MQKGNKSLDELEEITDKVMDENGFFNLKEFYGTLDDETIKLLLELVRGVIKKQPSPKPSKPVLTDDIVEKLAYAIWDSEGWSRAAPYGTPGYPERAPSMEGVLNKPKRMEEARKLLSSLPFKSEAEIREDERKKAKCITDESHCQGTPNTCQKCLVMMEKNAKNAGKSEGRKEMMEEVEKAVKKADEGVAPYTTICNWLSEQKKKEGKA